MKILLRISLAAKAKYVKHLEFDKETGEVLEGKQRPYFDSDKLIEEEKYDENSSHRHQRIADVRRGDH